MSEVRRNTKNDVGISATFFFHQNVGFVGFVGNTNTKCRCREHEKRHVGMSATKFWLVVDMVDAWVDVWSSFDLSRSLMDLIGTLRCNQIKA